MSIGENILCEGIKDFGLKEKRGSASNPTLLSMIRKVFFWVEDDSKIAWCGIWLASVFDKLGIEKPDRFPVARSWLKIGKWIAIDDIEQGDICIFWRYNEKDWRGHVGIYSGQQTQAHLYILGGNQENKVGITGYEKRRLLGIRRVV